MQRFAPNATWLAVFHPPCPPDYGPPYALEIGETYGYIVRILVSGDSGLWRRGQIGGRYRAVSYISSEYRASGAWGRPVPSRCVCPRSFPFARKYPNAGRYPVATRLTRPLHHLRDRFSRTSHLSHASRYNVSSHAVVQLHTIPAPSCAYDLHCRVAR